MKIGVIIGSTRSGRLGESVARWVYDRAIQRSDAEFTLVDLKDFQLGLLDAAALPGVVNRQYDDPATRRWSTTIDSFDGFVFVTPEYNHGVPAALKNAVDVLYPEWNHKAVAFVAYGADGGVRAVEHWRVIAANVLMHDVRPQVSLSLFIDVVDGIFTPGERRAGELDNVLNHLVALTGALEGLRT
jgi:NAD(P)H-dependent FMN reductase